MLCWSIYTVLLVYAYDRNDKSGWGVMSGANRLRPAVPQPVVRGCGAVPPVGDRESAPALPPLCGAVCRPPGQRHAHQVHRRSADRLHAPQVSGPVCLQVGGPRGETVRSQTNFLNRIMKMCWVQIVLI